MQFRQARGILVHSINCWHPSSVGGLPEGGEHLALPFFFFFFIFFHRGAVVASGNRVESKIPFTPNRQKMLSLNWYIATTWGSTIPPLKLCKLCVFQKVVTVFAWLLSVEICSSHLVATRINHFRMAVVRSVDCGVSIWSPSTNSH